MNYTTGQLIAVVQREIEQRKTVYGRLVARGVMRAGEADFQIGAMARVLELLQDKHSRELQARAQAPQAAESSAAGTDLSDAGSSEAGPTGPR